MFTERRKKAILQFLCFAAISCTLSTISQTGFAAPDATPRPSKGVVGAFDGAVRVPGSGQVVFSIGEKPLFVPPNVADRVLLGQPAQAGTTYQRSSSYKPLEAKLMGQQAVPLDNGSVPPGAVQDVNLTYAPTDDIQPTVTKDRLTIYFASNATTVDAATGNLSQPGPTYHIWKMAADGSRPTPITLDVPGNQIQPAISPGGNILAYAMERGSGSGVYDIWIYDMVSQQKSRLTTFADNQHPTWSSSGTRVGFQSTMAGGSYKIWAVGIDGRSMVQLTIGNQADTSPAWSPDGQVIAFVRGNRICIVDQNAERPGFPVIQLTNATINGAASRDKDPVWSPPTDGLPVALTFASTRNDTNADGFPERVTTTYDIYSLPDSSKPEDTATNRPTAITSTPGDDEDPAWLDRVILGYKYDQQFNQIPVIQGRVIYTSNRAGTLGLHDIWRSFLIDYEAPTLEELPQVLRMPQRQVTREVSPGDTVSIRAKVTDYQSGVKSVFAQFRDPDSALQDSQGIDHKLYVKLNQGDAKHNSAYQVDPGAWIWPWVELGSTAIDPVDYSLWWPYNLVKQDGHWLQLYDDGPISKGGHEPEGEVAGDGWYTNTWKTPPTASDYYIDIIVRDNAKNEEVLDNIWGFTSETFNATSNILLVLDYGAGQGFMQGKQTLGLMNAPLARPTESYLTDNPTMFPQTFQDIPNMKDGDGTPVDCTIDVPMHTLAPRSPYITSMPGMDPRYAQMLDLGDYYDLWRVQCRGPISQEQLRVYSPQVKEQPDENNKDLKVSKLVASRCVVWASPYAGDMRVGPGTIVDPATQQLLLWYLKQGGRVLLTGQDVAWALTMNGVVTNDLLTAMGVDYIDDADRDTITSYFGHRHYLSGVTDGGPGMDPISNDPWKYHWLLRDNSSFTPDYLYLSFLGQFYYMTTMGNPPTPYFSGSWTYEKRDKDAIHADGCPNQWWLDSVTPISPAKTAYYYDDDSSSPKGSAAITREDPSNSSRTIFMAFGLEGIHNGYKVINVNDLKTLTHLNRRATVMHNSVCWMRHGWISGTLKVLDPSNGSLVPLQDAIVSAKEDWRPGAIRGKTLGTALSLADGSYTVDGLDSSLYRIYAYKPGYTIQHAERMAVHGGMGITVDVVLTKAPAGRITGKVVDSARNPVVNAIVTATEAHGYNLVYTAVTKIDGTYEIDNVEIGDYKVTAQATGYGASDPAEQAVTVTPNTVTPNVDFTLKANPGSVSGTVTDAARGNLLAGVNVQILSGAVSVATTTTDTVGRYSIGGIDSGTYTVTASKPGYATQTKGAQVTSGTDAKVDFALAAALPGSISGVVTRAGSTLPVGGVRVRVINRTVATDGTVTDTVVGEVRTDPAKSIDADGNAYNYTVTNVPVGLYRVEADSDGLTAPAQTNIQVDSGKNTPNVNFSLTPLHVFPSGLSMISVPYDYSAQRLSDLLGITDIKLANWQSGAWAIYPTPPANTLTTGKAYFIKLSAPISIVSKGPEMDRTIPCKIPLDPGWNMIGDPFTGAAIPWMSCQIEADGTVYSIDQAARNGIIRGKLWEYTGGTAGYQEANTLSPWKGYWLRSMRACTLVVNSPVTVGSAAMDMDRYSMALASLDAIRPDGSAVLPHYHDLIR